MTPMLHASGQFNVDESLLLAPSYSVGRTEECIFGLIPQDLR